MDWESLPFDPHELEKYLSKLLKSDVEIKKIESLAGKAGAERIKEFGYGKPLLVEFTATGKEQRIVLHTMRQDKFGHERISDRARNLLLDHAVFNKLPRHVICLDVGGFTVQGELRSLGDVKEFFLITRYAPGQLYASDLQRIAAEGALSSIDETRVDVLAKYLTQIHSKKETAAILYRRCLRDWIGHGEGIMGMMDSYPADFPVATPARRARIEKKCITWRWKIKDRTHRLSQVHGDFHPWNILFQEESEFTLLDRSRGEWGEPADDVSAMTINYLFFSLREHGKLAGPFRSLYDLFWERYLSESGDREMLEVVQPFYAWRALVLAHPVWYPSLDDALRERLFRFIENVLQEEFFDPQRINDYLE